MVVIFLKNELSKLKHNKAHGVDMIGIRVLIDLLMTLVKLLLLQ